MINGDSMRKVTSHILFLILALALFPSLTLAANVGKVKKLVGQAHILKDSALKWDALKKGYPLNAGDIVRTMPRSTLMISLKDGSVLFLAEDTKLKIKAVSEKEESFFSMFSGKMRAVVRKRVNKRSKFKVRTRTALAGVKGTDFIIIIKKDLTIVVTYEGVVAVSNVIESIAGEVTLKQNYYTEVARNMPPTEPELLTPEEIEDIINDNGLSEEAMGEEPEDDLDDTGMGTPVETPTFDEEADDIEEPDEFNDVITDSFDDFGFGDDDRVATEPDVNDSGSLLDEPPPPPNK